MATKENLKGQKTALNAVTQKINALASILVTSLGSLCNCHTLYVSAKAVCYHQ